MQKPIPCSARVGWLGKADPFEHVPLRFVDAQGGAMSRETLRHGLGKPTDQAVEDGLNATMYRLRRRIEHAMPHLFPLQSKSRVG